VRFGGDEFVCALPDTDPSAARRRFEAIREMLRSQGQSHAISVGIAAFERDDELQQLIARADAAVLEGRRAAGHHSELAASRRSATG